MHRPIHGLAGLLHPAFKAPSLFRDLELLADRDAYLARVIPQERHASFFQQIIDYNDQRGHGFQNLICWKRESVVKPLFWWENFGYGAPDLQQLALRVLSQDCSSGACERNWSSYSLIHTKLRNKLSTKQLEILVYCRANLRMVRNLHAMDRARQVN